MRPNYRIFFKTQVMLLAFAVITALPVHAKSFEGKTIGQPSFVIAKFEDTLANLAQTYELGYAQFLAANQGVDPLIPGAGKKLVMPTWHILPDGPRKGLVINTGELRMYYFPPDGSAPKSYPIGIGREGLSSPKGTSTVVRKAKDPVWRPTPRMRLENPELPAEIGPGDENPLGAHALYMGWPGYLIHGTNKPQAVGRRASSGCIRMYADHIEWLYDNVPVGTPIASINQPIKMAWINDQLFIEAEPNDIQVDELEYQSRLVTIDVPNGIIAKIRQKAGDQAERVDWALVRNILIERTGLPTQITMGPDVTPRAVAAKPAGLSLPSDSVQTEQKEPLSVTEKPVEQKAPDASTAPKDHNSRPAR